MYCIYLTFLGCSATLESRREVIHLATKYPKETTLYIRVGEDLKQHLQREAEKLGLPLSSWARSKLIEVSGYTPPSRKPGR